jgi:hypothetical protein
MAKLIFLHDRCNLKSMMNPRWVLMSCLLHLWFYFGVNFVNIFNVAVKIDNSLVQLPSLLG